MPITIFEIEVQVQVPALCNVHLLEGRAQMLRGSKYKVKYLIMIQ